VLEQNTAEGEARTVFCGSRAAERRRSSYRLLCDGFAYANIFQLFFILYIHDKWIPCTQSKKYIHKQEKTKKADHFDPLL